MLDLHLQSTRLERVPTESGDGTGIPSFACVLGQKTRIIAKAELSINFVMSYCFAVHHVAQN